MNPGGREVYRLDLPQLQTLVFLTLVFSGQATVYLVWERRHLWDSRPGRLLVLSSVADAMIVSLLATFGILTPASSPSLIFGLLAFVAIYVVLLDFLKHGLFRRFGLH